MVLLLPRPRWFRRIKATGRVTPGQPASTNHRTGLSDGVAGLGVWCTGAYLAVTQQDVVRLHVRPSGGSSTARALGCGPGDEGSTPSHLTYERMPRLFAEGGVWKFIPKEVWE